MLTQHHAAHVGNLEGARATIFAPFGEHKVLGIGEIEDMEQPQRISSDRLSLWPLGLQVGHDLSLHEPAANILVVAVAQKVAAASIEMSIPTPELHSSKCPTWLPRTSPWKDSADYFSLHVVEECQDTSTYTQLPGLKSHVIE